MKAEMAKKMATGGGGEQRHRPVTRMTFTAGGSQGPPAFSCERMIHSITKRARIVLQMRIKNHEPASIIVFATLALLSLPAQRERQDPLPSWNDSAPKKAIVDFRREGDEGRLAGFRSAGRAHRHVRQRRHALVRAADVFPIPLRARPREGARAAASRVEGRRNRSPRCSRAT